MADKRTSTPKIDENWLAEQIASVWGEYGAHIDIYREAVRRAKALPDMRNENHVLRQNLEAMLEVFNQHEYWCGFNENAPGWSYQEHVDRARAVLAGNAHQPHEEAPRD